MHAKFYLFSAVGASQFVSMISSANITSTNSKKSWNNIHTVVGDAKVYESLKTYLDDMVKDKRDRHYYRTTSSGKYKLYLFPRAPKPGVNTVVLSEVLDHVRCSAPAASGGKSTRTVIRVAMYSWSAPRNDIATKLWRLHDKGCRVEVIYNSGRASTKVTRTLLKRSATYGVIRVFDSWVDRNYNDRAELYMHHKVLTINGVWYGRPHTKVVYTGSQNFTANATDDNNDIIFRMVDDAAYDAYTQNLNYIRSRSPLRTWW
jgi:hypothetical protein